jgi:hypothetical protein
MAFIPYIQWTTDHIASYSREKGPTPVINHSTKWQPIWDKSRTNNSQNKELVFTRFAAPLPECTLLTLECWITSDTRLEIQQSATRHSTKIALTLITIKLWQTSTPTIPQTSVKPSLQSNIPTTQLWRQIQIEQDVFMFSINPSS